MKYRALSSIFYSDNNKYLEVYKNRFNSESTYRFNFRINGNPAFLVINHDILQKVEYIMELDRELVKKMNRVPDIALSQYKKKCLIDEVRMTNEIEGVASTRKEINDILSDKTDKNKNRRLYGLVKKYQLLGEEDIKLSKCEDIRKIYDELVLKEVLEEDISNEPDGLIFRKDKVYVKNSHGKTIHTGVYPEEEILKSMTDGLEILNNEDYDFLIRIAVFHYIFAYIHPFYDGNGRTTRFISSYLLSQKLQNLISYKLSHTIKENINTYYKSFKEANDEKNRGDLTIFVMKFFDILIRALEDLNDSLDERGNKLKFFENIASKAAGKDDKKANLLFILVQNTLFGDEGLSIEELCDIFNTDKYNLPNIGESKLRNSLKELEQQGVLYITKDGRKKLYDVNIDVMSNLYL